MKNDKRNNIFNPKNTKKKRRYLRNNMTKAEIKLWSALRNRKLCGKKFRRQHGIGNYVIDFYCPELNLAVEVDGESHYYQSGIKHDKERREYLSSFDIKVIRYTNSEVFKNLEGVVKTLEMEIIKLSK